MRFATRNGRHEQNQRASYIIIIIDDAVVNGSTTCQFPFSHSLSLLLKPKDFFLNKYYSIRMNILC